jgi:hypothetical protein
MLQQAGTYNKHIEAGFSVLHALTQARCDELGCNVHPSMSQLGWCSTLQDGAAHPVAPLRCNNTLCRFLCSWALALRSHRLALLLALPAHVAAQTAITNANFKTAADAWSSNAYGPIADWNTAPVTSMYQVCAASAGARNAADALGRYSEIYR